ncbi:MAG: D-2-hydroxyacid dehydrogenase [Chloroflexi bacterium]|nr:D-2-hydroxyacid dehydrogenase [Chloroflexota bacterium]
MEQINVLVTYHFAPPQIEQMANISSRLNIIQREAKVFEDLADVVDQVDVMYVWRSHLLPQPEQSDQLQWVQLHSAGFDHLLEHPLFSETGIMFTTTSGVHATPIAEYTLAQMLAFAQRLPSMLEDKARKQWSDERYLRFMPRELRGSTLGLVGYGSIGREIARLAQAFGMRILAVKRDLRNLTLKRYSPGTHIGDPDGSIPDRIYPTEALHSFLAECDFVVITVPLTADTYHLMDEQAFAAMRSDAVLINISRGKVVDEVALIDALKNEQIGGAALDVFEHEPLDTENPLWTQPQVILSPHISGITPQYAERAAAIFIENLERYVRGEPLINLVDRESQY